MKGLEFYSAAAQIIPLLLILLGFQAQSFSNRLSNWAYWIVLLAITGETCALVALYTEDTKWWVLNLLPVSLALIVLGVLVFLATVLAPSGRFLSMRRPTRKDGEEN